MHFMLRALHKQFVTNDPAGALEDYRFVSELHPDMFQPYNNSGRILIQLGRYPEAAAMFAALFLGLALTAAGRDAEARRVYQAEITRLTTGGPSDRYAEGRLSTLHAAAGPRRQAESIAARLLARQPGNPWFLYTIARTRALLDDEKGAADLLRKARAAGYDHPYFVPWERCFWRTMPGSSGTWRQAAAGLDEGRRD
jgi:tetratricopeptide (TPR) repeat protein